MGKESKRKRRAIDGKGSKSSVSKDKGVLSLLSGRSGFPFVFFLIAVTALFTAYNRNLVWKDDTTLWEDVVRKSSEKERGHNNLGNSYSELGRTAEAIEEYREALRLKPDYVDAHNNLGTAYAMQGRIDEAIGEYKQALRLTPRLCRCPL
jgi:tetratricopeptide (TPR) repeat protein